MPPRSCRPPMRWAGAFERTMSRKTLGLMIGLCLAVVLSACGAEPAQGREPAAASEAAEETGTPAPEQTMTITEGRPDSEAPAEEEGIMSLQMKIGETAVTVDWEDNASVEALKELCREDTLCISMSMYGGFEQVGSIGTSLPRSDVQTRTSSGDIVLYAGNQLVVFYGSNSWAYTRLGHISDQSEEDLTALLGSGDVTITLSMEAP